MENFCFWFMAISAVWQSYGETLLKNLSMNFGSILLLQEYEDGEVMASKESKLTGVCVCKLQPPPHPLKK